MIERYKPPLAVVIVGCSNSTDWSSTTESGKVEWSFLEDLFRCLSYDIGSREAANPEVPVYFSIGRFGTSDEASQPPLIDCMLAQRILVLVLLEPEFRRGASQWVEFFNEQRKHAQKANKEILFVPMARADDGQLRRDIHRLGLGTIAPVYARSNDGQSQQTRDSTRYFRISAMIAAIQTLRQASAAKQSIDVFLSYAKRDGAYVPELLRQAFSKYPGVNAIVDSMAFSPGVSVSGDLLEQKLAASDCVVVCQTTSYSSRIWCQREALLAKRTDVPMIVVDMRDGLDRLDTGIFANCPQLRVSEPIEGHLDKILELAISEVLRAEHHRHRSAAIIVAAGVDPERVEILTRPPELSILVELVARNAEAVRQGNRPRDVILHPNPPLRDYEVNMLRMIGENFQFSTPSTIITNTLASEESLCRA
ncbi:toll/interleukin-1 receptor domain-containing protein [Mesorhizobium sp. LjNodule214]|uniref:toll/interleukin-1 receptor domain-containing protein n=1 Tax=Mesorhizobium sp. LjNodule214 TaxID=3342252 RepID=UPI003ECECF52